MGRLVKIQTALKPLEIYEKIKYIFLTILGLGFHKKSEKNFNVKSEIFLSKDFFLDIFFHFLKCFETYPKKIIKMGAKKILSVENFSKLICVRAAPAPYVSRHLCDPRPRIIWD